MEKYIEKKDFDFKMLELQNNFYNLAISQAEFIKQVLKKFDGKKITKRITNELNKNNNGITFYLKRELSWWELYIYCEKDFYQTAPDKNGVCGSVYIKDRCFYYLSGYRGEQIDILNYADAEKQINEKITYRIEQMKKQKETISKLDKLIEDRNKLLKQVEDNTKELQKLRNFFIGHEYWLNCKIN